MKIVKAAIRPLPPEDYPGDMCDLVGVDEEGHLYYTEEIYSKKEAEVWLMAHTQCGWVEAGFSDGPAKDETLRLLEIMQ